MLFNTPTQLAVLGLLLIVGWLFGFASHPGGKRWRRAYEDEAVGRAQDRDDLDTQLRSQDARIKELEQEKAALAAELAQAAEVRAPVVSELVRTVEPTPAYPAPEAPVIETPVAAEAARPAFVHAPVTQPEPVAAAEMPVETQPLPIKRGWFDWGKSDDLSTLRGVDAGLAERLKAEGIDSFTELGKLNDQEEIALERRLDLPAGYIMKEQLREQARLLADGNADEHASRFGA